MKLMKNNSDITYRETHKLTNKIYSYETFFINKLKNGDDNNVG